MPTNGRTPEQVRRELAQERDGLASAVEQLRTELSAATDVSGRIRANLPVAAAGAASAGFVLAGGLGATMRLLKRRFRSN